MRPRSFSRSGFAWLELLLVLATLALLFQLFPSLWVGTVIGGPVIVPGEGAELTMTINTRGETQIRQQVLIELVDDATGQEKSIQFCLLANQPAPLELIPAAIDFGRVRHGASLSRRCFLRETTDDHFAIEDESVDLDGLPAQFSLTSKRRGNGLREYELTFALNVDGLAPGHYSHRVCAHTTSALRPEVELPVEYNVESNILADPSILAFGVLGRSSQRTAQIELKSVSGDRDIRATVANQSRNIVASIQQVGCDALVTVELTPTNTGPWNGELQLVVSDGASRDIVTIPCTAFISDR